MSNNELFGIDIAKMIALYDNCYRKHPLDNQWIKLENSIHVPITYDIQLNHIGCVVNIMVISHTTIFSINLE